MSVNMQSEAQTGGVCGTHGVYTGRCLPCAETKVRADLRQSVWEGSQFLTYGQIRALVDAVICEIEADAP